MTPDLFTIRAPRAPPPPRSPAPNWKPEGCADCGLLHPSFSVTGPQGPWRCADCHYQAKEASRA